MLTPSDLQQLFVYLLDLCCERLVRIGLINVGPEYGMTLFSSVRSSNFSIKRRVLKPKPKPFPVMKIYQSQTKSAVSIPHVWAPLRKVT